jgi:hypothetical protein
VIFVWWLPRVGCRTTPLQALKVCDREGWPYPRLHLFFSVRLHILHFLDIQMFEFKFELSVHLIHFKRFLMWVPREGCRKEPL